MRLEKKSGAEETSGSRANAGSACRGQRQRAPHTGSDCERALTLPMSDYEDALLAACAKRNRLDLIITRNLKDFTGSPVKAMAPDAFRAGFRE
ncbi:PIN domain-containing protein [Gelria sp. Kuro-4]|uniref:PIN domain-containing protein n=1 Tax=Gelria sp. Kuro-4 TaxID=2796927 RepID=UPI00351CDA76